MRSRRSAALLLPLLPLACGETRQAGRDRALVVAVPAGPASLKPNAIDDGVARSILANVYQTLVDLDAESALRPGLAEAWRSDGGLRWVFTLRRGVLTHDGKTFSARDAVRSLRLARDDRFSLRRAELAPLRGIEAPDPWTLVLTTSRPLPTLPARLAHVHIAATGPYRIRSWLAGGDTVLEAFPEHWAGAPALSRAVFRIVPDAAERVRALREGRAQLALEVPGEARTASRIGSRVLALAMDSVSFASPYVSTAANPFRDLRVRSAVAQAIDREALLRGPGLGLGSLDDLAAPSFDPAAAPRLLAEAGYAAGFEVTLDVALAPPREQEAVVASLAEALASVGIRVVPRRNLPRELATRLERRDTAFILFDWTPSDTEAERSRDPLELVPIWREADLYAGSPELGFRPRRDGRLRVAEMRWLR